MADGGKEGSCASAKNASRDDWEREETSVDMKVDGDSVARMKKRGRFNLCIFKLCRRTSINLVTNRYVLVDGTRKSGSSRKINSPG